MDNVLASLSNAVLEIVNAGMIEVVKYDTKVYAFDIATVATITFLAIAILSGLGGGSGLVSYSILAGLSLVARELIRINIEETGFATSTADAFIQNAQRIAQSNRDAPDCLSKFFKSPILSLDVYFNNIHLLTQ